MKVVQLTPQLNLNTKRNTSGNVNFKGAEDAATFFLRFLETNQAWGANAVDLGSMVIPRTLIDMTRNPQAGLETMRREASGTVNHSLIGLYGTGAGLAIAAAMGLNKKFGIRADKIYADSTTWDHHGKNWLDKVNISNADERLNKYIDSFLEDIRVYRPEINAEQPWVKISAEDKPKLVEAWKETLSLAKESGKNPTKVQNNLQKALFEKVKSLSLAAYGTESRIKLVHDSANTYSLKTVISNFYNVSKAFMSENVADYFKSPEAYSKLLNKMKGFNIKRSLGGLGIAAAVGMSIQPFNMYLTKKKTGSDGFVGVDGAGRDTSFGFKAMKTLTGLAFMAGAIALIGKPRELLSKLQFQGAIPTMNQFKFVYGATIMSRFFAARSKDELRESVLKDTLGFLNWLVLGNFVAKGVAYGLDKTLIRSSKEDGRGLKWLLNIGMKTRDEILHESLKKLGINTLKDGKAMKFSELLKLLPRDGAAAKTARAQLRRISVAQVAGYLWSGIVLGVCMPKLNIYMTKRKEHKRQTMRVHSEANMYKPENLAFLSKQMNFTAQMLNK